MSQDDDERMVEFTVRLHKSELAVLRRSAILFMIGAAGWSLWIANQFRTPTLVAPAGAAISKADLDFERPDPSRSSSYARIDDPGNAMPRGRRTFLPS